MEYHDSALLTFSRFTMLCLFILGVLLIGVIGSFDYDEAKAAQKLYCENVSTGAWPDYNKNFAEICKNKVDR